MHRITNGKLWRTPISEMEAISLKFFVDLKVFKAFSLIPRGTGAVQENDMVNVSLWLVSECCQISGKIAEKSIWSPVDSEFKCQKRLSVLLRGVLKIEAPLLTLKADLHFGKKKKSLCSLMMLAEVSLTDKDMWNTEQLHDPLGFVCLHSTAKHFIYLLDTRVSLPDPVEAFKCPQM